MDQILNRREFFKSGAQKIIPVLCGIFMSKMPVFAKNNTPTDCQSSCSYTCRMTCRGCCMSTCSGNCRSHCQAGCSHSCKTSCQNTSTYESQDTITTK